ncbi:hypothetical protein [Salinimicrobium sp. TH3]|uniref:hypothetical protein n=1 Tax=Salinimicrobium sp. TH3 TaxID=2997342 RepID=UPI002273728C|nr:hypothetical protein [Salinimicrobium sp. TH3]MCY2687766.1 hypothetical protein [Salinimicrobium sp. TH3]
MTKILAAGDNKLQVKNLCHLDRVFFYGKKNTRREISPIVANSILNRENPLTDIIVADFSVAEAVPSI